MVSCCKRFIGTVPKPKNREHQWWGYIKSKLPAITQAGFTALWLPPANKAAWWKSTGYDPYDYFNQSGVDALIKVHEQNAAGPTQVLYVNDDLYVMQRLGDGDQSGLILVLNNRGTWNGTWVQTRWNNARLVPAAWRGHNDPGVPKEKWTNESGWINLWAPPRGYTVYVPE